VADCSSGRCDIIAQQMWDDHVCICNERGIGEDDQSGGEYEEFEGEEEDEGSDI